jgi:hypothetical protein
LVEVINTGFRSATIETPYLRIVGKKTSLFTPIPTASVNFPHELKEGTSCKEWIREDGIREELKKRNYSGKVQLIAVVNDQAGQQYQSKEFIEFNVDTEG